MPLCGGIGELQQATAETQQLVNQVRVFLVRSSRLYLKLIPWHILNFADSKTKQCLTFILIFAWKF